MLMSMKTNISIFSWIKFQYHVSKNYMLLLIDLLHQYIHTHVVDASRIHLSNYVQPNIYIYIYYTFDGLKK